MTTQTLEQRVAALEARHRREDESRRQADQAVFDLLTNSPGFSGPQYDQFRQIYSEAVAR